MSTVRPSRRRASQAPEPGEPRKLPQRWAIIAMITAAAAVIGNLAGGPVAAITVATAVLVAAHRVLD